MTDYFDLGSYSRKTSAIPEAQGWFDRGIVWLFSYNHEEAIVCFEKHLLLIRPTLEYAHKEQMALLSNQLTRCSAHFWRPSSAAIPMIPELKIISHSVTALPKL